MSNINIHCNSINYESLCDDLKFRIAEYVSPIPERNIPFNQEYKDVLVDWYNKYSRHDQNWEVKRSYDELYSQGSIPSSRIPYMKYGFYNYGKEKRYYRLHFSPSIGGFAKSAMAHK